MDMQTDALRWFQQVADGVTVTEVSETERVSQPGISRALARLESEVGAPLLRRSGRTLRMTRAGAAFKRYVDAMLHVLDDGLAAVNQMVDPETGVVAIAFQPSLGTWLVPDLVSSFQAAYPEVSFVLRQVRDEMDSAVLGEAHVDLEISSVRPTDEALRWRPFLLDPLRLAVPRGHELASRTSLALAETSHETFIGLRRTTALRRQSDLLCQRAGFEARVSLESDDLPTLKGLVAAGLGVAIVPAVRVGSSETADGPVAYVAIDDPGASRQLGLIWSADRRLMPSSELFRRHVVDRSSAGVLPEVVRHG